MVKEIREFESKRKFCVKLRAICLWNLATLVSRRQDEDVTAKHPRVVATTLHRTKKMQSTCQHQQAQPGQNGTSASRTSFLIEDILSRGTVTPHSHHHPLHHQHLTSTSAHGQHHQYQQFASLLPGYPTAPPTAAAFFLGPLFGSASMGVGVVPGVGELAALKHCRRRKARTVSTFLIFPLYYSHLFFLTIL